MIRKEDCIKVGKIIKSHNLQGEVVIATENDLLEEYAEEPVFILLDGAPVPFFIADNGLTVRNQNSYIIKFDDVNSLAQAERLVGCEIFLEEAIVGEQQEEYVEENDIFALKGFAVMDENSGQKGIVSDVADYAGNIVFSIDILGKEILLPFSEHYIKDVNFENKELTVSIPQELVDLN